MTLTPGQLKVIEDIEKTELLPKDLLHPIERHWVKAFRIKFETGDLRPCEMGLKMLAEIYKKATDPNWKPSRW